MIRTQGVMSPRIVSGLRTRFTPKSRIGHGFVSMAPWFDVVLIVLFFFMLESRFVLQPGIAIELPRAPFTGGLSSDLIAVVLAVESGTPGKLDEIVFFDDDRYLVDDAGQMARLRRAVHQQFRRTSGAGLIVDADAAVRQGTLVQLFELARQVGLERVSLGTRDAKAPEGRP